MAGYGASCDADHITAGLPDGSGAYLAMIGALANVIPLDDIQDQLWLINAHATSTPRGDLAEINAAKLCLNRLIRDHESWNIDMLESGPFVTAHKCNVGHMMSAAGAFESVFCAKTLQTGHIPGIVNLDHPEEGIGDQFHVLKTSTQLPKSSTNERRLVLKNSFGFGGTNASLVFAEYIS